MRPRACEPVLPVTASSSKEPPGRSARSVLDAVITWPAFIVRLPLPALYSRFPTPIPRALPGAQKPEGEADQGKGALPFPRQDLVSLLAASPGGGGNRPKLSRGRIVSAPGALLQPLFALTKRQDGCQGAKGRLPLSPGRPFLAPPLGLGGVAPSARHGVRYPDTSWRSQAKAGRSLSQARTHGDGKASRLGPRFEARARGQGQREPVQSAASASLQTSKQLLAYSSSDRKQKPGRLALFGRPRFVAFSPGSLSPARLKLRC